MRSTQNDRRIIGIDKEIKYYKKSNEKEEVGAKNLSPTNAM